MPQIYDKKCDKTWPNRASAYGHFMKSKYHQQWPKSYTLDWNGLKYNVYQEHWSKDPIYTPINHNISYEQYKQASKIIKTNQKLLEEFL